MPFDRVMRRVVLEAAQPFTTGGDVPEGLHLEIAGDYQPGNTFVRLRLAVANGGIAPTPAGVLSGNPILTANGFEYELLNDVQFAGDPRDRALPAFTVDLIYDATFTPRNDTVFMIVTEPQSDAAAERRTSRGIASYLNALGHASVTVDNQGTLETLRVDMYPNIRLSGDRATTRFGLGTGDVLASDGTAFMAAFPPRQFVPTSTFVGPITVRGDVAAPYFGANPSVDLPPVPVGECIVELASPLVAPLLNTTTVQLAQTSARERFWGTVEFSDSADEIVLDADTAELATKVTLDVRLPYGSVVSPSERLLVDGAVYDILAVRPSVEQGRAVEVTATRLERAAR